MTDVGFMDCAPVFIVGAPRSGLTLLQRVLDAHPALAILDEGTYFEALLKLQAQVPDLAVPGAVGHFFALLPTLEQYSYWNGMEDLFERTRVRLEADSAPSYPKVYRFLMEAYAERCDKRRCGDKTPENVRYLPELKAMFPKACFLHLVRDPRSSIASKLKLDWASDDVLSNAMKWKLDVRAARRFSSRPEHRESLLEICYEDLIREPEQILRRVCDFLGERFEPAMLEQHTARPALFKNSPWKEGALRRIGQGATTDWRVLLQGRRLALVQWLLAAEMCQFGYRPVKLSVLDGLLMPCQALIEVARWVRFRRAHARRRTGIGADASRLSTLACQTAGLRFRQRIRH